MDDSQIIALYWERSESAISETAEKYGRYCHYIAYNILNSDPDAEECVNDTYLNVWNSIPPHKPNRLSTFLGKITRNLALNRFEKMSAVKRSSPQADGVFHELRECIPDQAADDPEETLILKDSVNRFLRSLPQQAMLVFLRRYWYFSSIDDIAADYHLSKSNVKVTLYRTREKFRAFLIEEGIAL